MNTYDDFFVSKKQPKNKEKFDIEKIHRMLSYATDGISGTSISQIEHNIKPHLHDGISTSDIHEMLIKSTADLIDDNNPNYQFVAARLVNFKIRKEVYRQYQPPSLHDIVTKNVANGVYDSDLINFHGKLSPGRFSKEDFDYMDTIIDHERDLLLTYSGIEQFRQKYLVRDHQTGQIHESPQIAYALITMLIAPGTWRWKEFYDLLSQHKISLPTPIIAGLRTPLRQYSSCVLIETDDSIESINATASAITTYISKRAGIGIGTGAIRAEGSPINMGQVKHTGIIPFLRYFQSAIKSCSQGGIRGGAGTAHYPIWHMEFEDLVVLKNNKGTEESRLRHMDHSFQLSRLFYHRFMDQGNITFFSPADVPGLLKAFYKGDQSGFEELYVKYENDPDIRKKTLPAVDVFTKLMSERKDTGRIYIQNVDNVNSHSSFIDEYAPIKMSNLCQEITLPTMPVHMYDGYDEDLEDQWGEIALCTLGAINWGEINKPEDFEMPCRLLVRALDNILSYQEYPLDAAQRHTQKYRPLGIGINNFAFFLAKRGMTYSFEGDKFLEDLKIIDEYAEAWSYYLIRASIDEIKLNNKTTPWGLDYTKYSKGIVPIDTYNSKRIDTYCDRKPSYDWDSIREDLLKYGIRNGTLMALMPCESSSLVSNATNGIEPARALVTYKQSKDGIIPQVVPQIHHLKNKYDLLWDQKSAKGYLIIMGVLQKWIDQGISVNTSYNPAHYPDHKIPVSVLMQDLFLHYTLGGKQLYYNNTNDMSGHEPSNDVDGCGDSCVL